MRPAPWLFFAAAFLFSACQTQPPPGPSESAATTPVAAAVSTVAAASGAGGLRFGLAPGNCVDGKCRAVLQLLGPGGLLDSAPLEFAASEASLRKSEGETGLTAGAALDAWTAGKEDGSVTTALRAVNLAAGRPGVLVYQVGGFEHLKRRYDLYTAEASKLKQVWYAQEGQGPVWSSAETIASPNGTDEIVYLSGVRVGGEDADQLDARRLGWDDTAKSMSERPQLALPAVLAGRFPSVAAARRAAGSNNCLADYWVLPSGALGGKKATGFVLAKIVASQSAADAEQGRPCEGKPAANRKVAVFKP